MVVIEVASSSQKTREEDGQQKEEPSQVLGMVELVKKVAAEVSPRCLEQCQR